MEYVEQFYIFFEGFKDIALLGLLLFIGKAISSGVQNDMYSNIQSHDSFFTTISNFFKSIFIGRAVSPAGTSASQSVTSDILEDYKSGTNPITYVLFLIRNLKKIEQEIEDTKKSRTINLANGVAFSSIGFIFLYLYGVNAEPKNNIYAYAPVASIFFGLEVFAFFFLGLYKNGHDKVQSYINETSNIHSKISALLFNENQSNNGDNTTEILKTLLNCERNFKLSKGETSLEIEKKKINMLDNSELIGVLNNIVNKILTKN